MMPKVDGYQVLTWLRGSGPAWRSPRDHDLRAQRVNSVVRCIELGAVDYLLKPFNPVLLKARLGATLEKKRLRDEIDAHLARLEAELNAARRLQMAMVPQSFPAPTQIFLSTCVRAWSRRARSAATSTIFSLPRTENCASWSATSPARACRRRCSWHAPRALIRIATDLMRSENGTSVGPADIIARVNRELCQDNSDMMFVTLFFAMLRQRAAKSSSAMPVTTRRTG